MPGLRGSAAPGLRTGEVWRHIVRENTKAKATNDTRRGCDQCSTDYGRAQEPHGCASESSAGVFRDGKGRLNSLSSTICMLSPQVLRRLPWRGTSHGVLPSAPKRRPSAPTSAARGVYLIKKSTRGKPGWLHCSMLAISAAESKPESNRARIGVLTDPALNRWAIGSTRSRLKSVSRAGR